MRHTCVVSYNIGNDIYGTILYLYNYQQKMKVMKKFVIAMSLVTAISLTHADVSAQTTTKSRAGKDAAIGAAAGAVTGAVVSKKKGKGAIIGGVAGAAGGYAWGKHQDKKKGRKVVRKG
jgi:uncharacterized protein YqgC (DUF456 family)